MTEADREALAERLKALDESAAAIELASRPFTAALAALDDVREGLLEAAGVERIEHCEFCDGLLITGDAVHKSDDAGYLCESCAPSWADIKAAAFGEEPHGRIAFDDEQELEGIKAIVREHEAAGTLATKHVWPLD